MVDKIINQTINSFKYRWKTLVISFALTFTLVFLQQSGLKLPTLFNSLCFVDSCQKGIASPLTDETKALDVIRPQLEKKENNFEVKKPVSLVPQAFAVGDFQEASAYSLVEFETGKVIAEKNLSKSLPIASLTKIMTAVVALDLTSPEDLFTVSEKASKTQPTRLAFTAGDKATVEELLNGIMLTSANDCAYILQEGIDEKYGKGTFIRAMNAKAKFLGMKDSYFTNPAGFDFRNPFSSVEDLTVLTHYALTNYPLFAQIVQKDHEILEANENHREEYLNNWQGLLGVYPGVSGVKIGNTDDAGKTTAVVSERGGVKLIAILLGAPGVLERDLWTAQLLDFGFENNYGLVPVKVTEEQLTEKYATWKYFN